MEKKTWLIVTFDTTTSALEMEEEAKKAGLPGRIIPLPTEISAGCGLSWRTDPGLKDETEAFMKERGLAYGRTVLIDMPVRRRK